MMGYTTPPSLEDMTTIAEEIVDELPDALEKYVGKLHIEVEDVPDDYIMDELDLEDPYDVFGVYQTSGPKALNRNGLANRQDILYLYRRPILDAWCDTQEDLYILMSRVILQEIGYHFGMTEDEIDMYEDEMTPESNMIMCE